MKRHDCLSLSRNRHSLRILVALVLIAAVGLLAPPVVLASFPDVPVNHPYAVAIGELSGRQVISGYTNGHFGPDDFIVRQQFAKVITLGLDLEALGDGTTDPKTRPRRIGTDTDWKLVAGGQNYALAVKNDGSLWSWGANHNGQLGDGTTGMVLVPARVGSGTEWKTVVAAGPHCLALQNDGSLWAWGRNQRGQLGLGTVADCLIPTRVGAGTDWEQVAVGHAHSAAIKADGSLWAWGWTEGDPDGPGSNDPHVPTRVE